MEPFKVSDLVRVVRGKLRTGDRNSSITGVSTDSRSVCSGDLFIAIRGPRFDGNQFASAALQTGATAALISQGSECSPVPGERAVVEVPDTMQAFHQLAIWYRDRYPVPAVAITGSCGKTTTKNMLAHLLSRSLRVVSSEKSFNNDIGVPLTILSMDRRTEKAVFEIGTNAPGEIATLTALVKPVGGIITNIHESHLKGLATVEGVLNEKAALIEALPEDGFAILNADDPRLNKAADRTRASVIMISCASRQADLWASDVVFHGMGTSFRVNDKYDVTLPLLGTHNVYNALAALGACQALGIDIPQVLDAFQDIPAASHRLERKSFGPIEVLDDSYNSNPGSARAAIRALSGIRSTGRKVLVLGDMLELGERSPELHFEVGDAVGETGVDLFIAVGTDAAHMVKGALAGGVAKSRVLYFPDTRTALEGIPELIEEGDLILVKGSRRLALEVIVNALAEKFGLARVRQTKAMQARVI